jgi:nitrogenase molybdenum-iron protein alpha/beta subunit
MRALPDGFNGAIMAVESITDAIAFLHGPGGCRVRHMVHSTAVFPREDPEDKAGYDIPYFYGYPRVPATYIDEYDYINGAAYKVSEGLPIVMSKNPALVVVINSPGAGLIGDNHEKVLRDLGLGSKVVCMDETLVSMPFTVCYGHTLRAVLEKIGPEKVCPEKDTVNIIGLTIMDKDWRAVADELRSLVESMGLKVKSIPGAGASVSELRDSVNAEYSIVVCPEACAGLSELYESYGVKVVRSDAGAPVGFDATEMWITSIAEATGGNPAAALESVRRAKDRVYEKFVGTKYNSLRIKGMSFSAAGTASVIRPLTEWLYNYLAMAPVAVSVDPGADKGEVEALKAFLDSAGYSESFGRGPEEGSGAVFCEGITAYTMALNGGCRIGVPIGHSSMGLDDVIPRPVYGVQGAMYILDEILHGVRGS